MTFRKHGVAALLCAATGIAADAAAGTTRSVALTSDDVLRGGSQSNGKPALQGDVAFATERRACIGTWGRRTR